MYICDMFACTAFFFSLAYKAALLLISELISFSSFYSHAVLMVTALVMLVLRHWQKVSSTALTFKN